jgi:hypothetical protein
MDLSTPLVAMIAALLWPVPREPNNQLVDGARGCRRVAAPASGDRGGKAPPDPTAELRSARKAHSEQAGCRARGFIFRPRRGLQGPETEPGPEA